MANRRMFSCAVTESDAFTDMPLSAQALYFHFGMVADDDGFVNSPKRVQRGVGASVDDFNLLIAKHFILVFDSGVIVIKHWRINNYLRGDRYKPTTYQNEFAALAVEENQAYTLASPAAKPGNDASAWLPSGIPDGTPMGDAGKDRLGKKSLGKGSEGAMMRPSRLRFTPPTVDAVEAYCMEKGYSAIDAKRFVTYHAARGWTLGKANAPMKDWRAAVDLWASSDRSEGKGDGHGFSDYDAA